MPARRHGAAANQHPPTRNTHQDPSAHTLPEPAADVGIQSAVEHRT
jgi:hypothetical protein